MALFRPKGSNETNERSIGHNDDNDDVVEEEKETDHQQSADSKLLNLSELSFRVNNGGIRETNREIFS